MPAERWSVRAVEQAEENKARLEPGMLHAIIALRKLQDRIQNVGGGVRLGIGVAIDELNREVKSL